MLVTPRVSGAQPVPIPDTWGGDFLSRPRLTGNWGGFRDDTTVVYASPPPAAPGPPSQFSTPAYTSPPPAQNPPCPNPAVATVNGVAYSKCGPNWFTQAYGANGPVFVPVATPPGF